MKLTRLICVLVVLIIFSVCANAHTENILGVDPVLIDSTMQGKRLIFQRKYDDALRLFDKIEQDYPDSVTGIFGKMAVWQIRMFENDDFRFRSQYEHEEKRYDKFAMVELRADKASAWDLFVLGAGDGMRGFFRAREGKWFQALSHSLHAMRMFKKLKWQEPDLVDTDLGIGMYTFWRSAFTSSLKFLPFFGDHRAEGRSLVEKVSREGKYSQDLAMANLVFIYSQEKMLEHGVMMADSILQMYPENIIMQQVKGEIKLDQKKFADAVEIFDKAYKQDPSINRSLYFKGVALTGAKKYGEARFVLEEYMSTNISTQSRSDTYFRLGLISEAEQKKDQAIEEYEKSISLQPSKRAKERLKNLHGTK